MRILDRYILLLFLKNYLISFMVLIGLYIVMDMVLAFDELAEVQGKVDQEAASGSLAVLRHIVSFYGFQAFLIFIHLSGVIPVVAAGFTLIRLTRFNELTAILAAGVPLLRIAVPIIIASLVLNVLLIIDQELIVPRLTPMLIRKHDQPQAASQSFPVKAIQDEENRLVVAGLFHPARDDAPAALEYLSVIQLDENFQPRSHISADSAKWDEGRQEWMLTNGKIIRGLLPNEPLAPVESVATYKSNITPEEIVLSRSGDYVQLLSTARINQLLQRPQSYGTINLLKVKHSRFTQWLLNMILLLLAVGTLLTRNPSSLKTRAVVCVSVVAACMASIFITQQLAGTPQGGAAWADRWPALMAWLPALIFGPIAVWLLDRVRT